MSSAAVMPSSSSSGPLTRRPTTGSRRAILAGIDASAARFGNPIQDQDSHAHPVPISNTDALLRSRKASDASSNAPNSNQTPAYPRSKSSSSLSQPKPTSKAPSISSQRSPSKGATRDRSIRASSSPPEDGAYRSDSLLAPPDSSGRSWRSGGGMSIRRRPSNLSQNSLSQDPDQSAAADDNRSISSRRSSKGSGFSNLLRRRSRTASASNGSPSDEAGIASAAGSDAAPAPSRLRTFSGTARRMSLKLDTRKRTPSVSSLFGPDKTGNASPESADLPPPVPALPEALRASGGPVRSNEEGNTATSEGYKTVQSPDGGSYSASPRSRRYMRQRTSPSPAQEAPGTGFIDPFAKADGTLARARSKSQGKSDGASLGRRQGSADSTSKNGAKADAPVSDDGSEESDAPQPAINDSLVGSAVAAASSAAAGVVGAAGTLLAKSNGDASADQGDAQHSHIYSDESSDEEFYDAELANITEGSEEEEDLEDDDGQSAEDQGAVAGREHKQAKNAALASPRKGKGSGQVGNIAGSSYKPRGTASASRRAGAATATAGAEQVMTPADAKANGDIPRHVRDKAARVAQLGVNDVKLTAEELRGDVEVARKALHLFLNSRMIEAEEIVAEHADTRLYYALGYAIIATIKGFMTFEPTDLASAISLCKDSLIIANMLRKPSSSVANFGRFVRGTGQSPSTLAGMDTVQKHAELVYAESLLLKAVLGIVYAGDFFAFVSEALNMRNAYGIYRSLTKYLEWADEKGATEGIDEDFRSGVYLGSGLISMILGLLPGKVLKIMEVFGYTGDCKWALKTLSKAGGWSMDAGVKRPTMPQSEEGVRRQICDMGLLLYHLVISTFIPVNGVDIGFADKVLHYNLKRYPDGVFFLYFSGRLYSTQALSEKAVKQFETARDVQKEYVQLKHICVWDLALCHMSLCEWQQAYENFKIMAEENNWSKAVYNYGRAATLYESAQGQDASKLEDAAELFGKVPGLTQKIAGKSIPMEKFVARKAKKFNAYNRLLLPGLEFSYVYHCLSNAPRFVLADDALVLVSDALAELHDVEDPSRYYSGEEYYDDLALAHFLRGVCLKFIAYPEKHSKVRPQESPIPEDEAAEQAEMSFKTVLEHGAKLRLDHWLVYFAHYELGRLYAGMGRTADAKEQLNLVLSQKTLEDRGRKGKYSLQNMVHLRANGALNALEGK
ncbi:uncharacterized protein PFL1_06807 [Pseudozyma flocculosa PF-1]|uniref:Uncharacterized protein n=2 Tax=Pseudozyma flocculosa TaxID=84751 RepID=A0A5C3F2L7_9BASI|nr:uncharacterized protein PFL1_06807 [Pseudozyma flocculosa PF-1]EPQ25627.1 hypothetical protein PFL1_06807 [Pseudozyma flocculosa PF-1]SPO38552.1 uncharacterized protein PSFLO_04030 [Pseudozyma flocculosa]